MNAWVIAGCFFAFRGKSMLAQTEMFVVFVLDETISQGSVTANGREMTYVS